MLRACRQNMSRNKPAKPLHFLPWRAGPCPYIDRMDTLDSPSLPPSPQAASGLGLLVRQDVGRFDRIALLLALLFLVLLGLAPVAARAQAAGGDALQAQVEGLLKQQSLPQAGTSEGAQRQPWRVEVTLGQLDPRLKLAPCDKVKAYLPENAQLWGKTRVGLRCEQGPVRWNVYWPVTVKVWGKALVAAVPLRPGTPIAQADVVVGEVDLAASTSPALTRVADIVGRTVLRPVEPGQSVRQDDVKNRRWFAIGDPVRLNVRGEGFLVASEGVALSPGDEGRCARVRMDNGRVLCGQPVGERTVEVSL